MCLGASISTWEIQGDRWDKLGFICWEKGNSDGLKPCPCFKVGDGLKVHARIPQAVTKFAHIPQAVTLALRQARAAAQSEQLQREKLAGQKKVSESTAQNENAAYKLTVRGGPGRVGE